MTRLLILGGGGMLGHKLWQTARDALETFATVRAAAPLVSLGFSRDEMVPGVDANDYDSIVKAFAAVRPDVVVNCIGVVKQLPSAKDPIVSISINGLFPHRVARLCRAVGARLIHISTDCVFSGRKGNYTEADESDAEDLDGRSKFSGEPGDGALTLRPSIIGREIGTSSGLVEWFLANRGKAIDGFEQAIFSGLTTLALAQVIVDLIHSDVRLSGVYHVSVTPISKFDLLQLLNDVYGAGVTVTRSDRVRIDRSLDSSRFRAAARFVPPPWPELLGAMAADPTPYDQWRSIQ